MTSSVFVWIHLPGDPMATLAGRADVAAGNRGSFVYAARYLRNKRALPLDPVALPLVAHEFVTTLLGGHFSVLLDAGPDAWGQHLIDLRHGAQTPYGYLLHTGGWQAGALSFSADPAVPPSDRTGDLATPTLAQFAAAASRVEQGGLVEPEWHQLLDAGSSAGGARPKFALEADARLWLAKLASRADRRSRVDVPLLEAATLTLARACGIDTPKFRLVHAARRNVLLVERFDRVRTASGWARLRYASARTVFHSNPELQRWSHSGSYGRFARELARWSVTPKRDRSALYRRMAFNCAVSNSDDHELNHGLVGTESGFSLAPAFDLVPQHSGTRRRMHALIVGDEGALASGTNLLSVAPVFGMARADAEQVIAAVAGTVRRGWRRTLNRLGASQAMVEAVAPRFQGGLAAITGA